MTCRLLLVLLPLGLPSLVFGNEGVDYVRDIKPIFAAKCIACHGSLKQEAELRLDASGLIREGSENGPVIVAGSAEKSLIYERVGGESDYGPMPPEGEGEPLGEKQLALVRAWLDSGAVMPEEPLPPDPRDHWSFRTPELPPVPEVAADWIHSPIDAFIAARQEAAGVKAVGPADPAVLLRRVYLDLTGLPPTRAELQEFLADPSPQAYEATVDRLLASPRYGERWGRHWMDVWRYSDWDGLGEQLRNSQKHIWRWRDWIIDSLNDDKTYDRMVREMLAGDELAPGDPEAAAGTGYLARNFYLFNRHVWLDDIVEHTSKAFMGITANCAKCHDHKFDPLSQREYYALKAFFEPHRVRLDHVPGQPDLEMDGLPRVFDAEPETPTYLLVRGDEKNPDKEHPISPYVPALLALDDLEIREVPLPPAAYYPGLREAERKAALASAQANVRAAEDAATKARQSLEEAQRKLAEFKALASAAPAAKDQPEDLLAVDPLEAFLIEDFSAPRDDVWKIGPGDWQYENGRLAQKQAAGPQSRMSTIAEHPRDFTATLRFKITAGGTRSVGILFDIEGDNATGVYMSPSGSKVQVYHTVEGKHIYPESGRASCDVQNDRDYELKFSVRDRLVNVWVDGTLKLAYTMEQLRRKGPLALTTYEAAAEFSQLTVAPLAADVQLADGKAADQPAAPMTEQGHERAVAAAERAILLAEAKLDAARTDVPAVEARLAADEAKYADPPAANAAELAAAAAKTERDAAVHQAKSAVLEAEHTLAAAKEAAKPGDKKTTDAVAAAEKAVGDANNKLAAAEKAAAEPGTNYTPFGKTYPQTSTGRRLALARWLTDRRHPLTARVAVNHIWLRHFGEPLVPSVFDFGHNGRPPTHPELLDWLAVTFMDLDWSMKRLHKTLLMSATYRLSSSSADADPANLKVDPDNRLLWRMNSRRMESQIVRDNVLFLSGQLDEQLGGPVLEPAQADKIFRRSMYFRHSRDNRLKFLTMFDDAKVEECYRRSESIVPQQALALANSSLFLSGSRKLAERLEQELQDAPPESFAEVAFETILSRRPNEDERAACVAALNELTELSTAQKHAAPTLRARQNLVHVLLNHNEFITVR